MRQIPFQARMEALELYLQGLSADKIVERTGISKGAVVSIIKDAREGKYPQLELKGRIDELHNMAVRLRKENLDLAQARLGFSFLQRILSINVSPDRLEEWIEFCSEISPTPPEGFIPAAMELFRIEKESGLTYTELASQVKELADKRQQLGDAIRDFEAKEKRYRELKAEIERNEKRANELKAQSDNLEGEVSFLSGFIEKRAKALGIKSSELEEKLKELVKLDAEIADKRSERNRLQGEIEALNERQQKLSSQMEKASADFERDIKLIREMSKELVQIAEMKGRYKVEVKDMEWAKEILPFLRYPDKVDDPDFKLASVVVDCIDKWLPKQNLGFPWGVKWGDVARYVQSKRTQFR
jgi:predicted  nucleic acid-binding Zn-ribbon protein